MARFQYQELASPPNVPAAPAFPDLSWAPEYPDPPARPRSSAVLAASFFGVFALAQFAVPANAWEAKYPERVRARVGLPAYEQQSLAYTSALPSLPVPALSWRSTYPDAISRRPGLRVELQQSYAQTIALPQYAVPERSWSPAYPDRAARLAGLRADLQQASAYTSALPSLPVPPLSWGPTYPDRPTARRVALAGSYDATGALRADPQAVPDLSWEGWYPDRLASLYRQQFHNDSTAALRADVAPAPLLAWAPAYPDAVGRRALGLRVDRQIALAYVPALPQFPFPALSWEPELVELVRARRRSPEGWHDAAAALRSDAAPAVPDLSWEPTYPDRLVLRRGVLAPWTDPTAALRADAAVVVPLSWRSSYPSSLARPAPRPTSPYHFEPVVVIPPLLGWAPSYPGPTARRPVTPGSSVGPVVVIPPLLAWSPRYPGPSERRGLPAREQMSHAYVPALAQFAVPALSWSPFYPNRLVRARHWPQDFAERRPLVAIISGAPHVVEVVFSLREVFEVVLDVPGPGPFDATLRERYDADATLPEPAELDASVRDAVVFDDEE